MLKVSPASSDLPTPPPIVSDRNLYQVGTDHHEMNGLDERLKQYLTYGSDVDYRFPKTIEGKATGLAAKLREAVCHRPLSETRC